MRDYRKGSNGTGMALILVIAGLFLASIAGPALRDALKSVDLINVTMQKGK